MAKAVWSIKDRANDLSKIPVKFDPETLADRQIKRIIQGWEKDGIPAWARRMIERGDAIQSES